MGIELQQKHSHCRWANDISSKGILSSGDEEASKQQS